MTCCAVTDNLHRPRNDTGEVGGGVEMKKGRERDRGESFLSVVDARGETEKSLVSKQACGRLGDLGSSHRRRILVNIFPF